MPFRSRVFLDCKSLVASIISVPVTGESLNLNKGTVSLDNLSGGLSEGLISSTIVAATEEKKMLKLFAISCGSEISLLLTKIFEIDESLLCFLFNASLIKAQDFF